MGGPLGDADVTTPISFHQVSFAIRLLIIVSISCKVGVCIF